MNESNAQLSSSVNRTSDNVHTAQQPLSNTTPDNGTSSSHLSDLTTLKAGGNVINVEPSVHQIPVNLEPVSPLLPLPSTSGLYSECAAVIPENIIESDNLALSFSGAGFLGTYHFGVGACLHLMGSAFLGKVNQMAGCSAGSLAAAVLLLCPHRIRVALYDICKLSDEVRACSLGALTPGFHLHQKVRTLIEKYVPEDISPVQGKITLSVTHRKSGENRLLSHFSCREEFINALSASCFIPFYSGGLADVPQIKGEQFYDGSITNNLPTIDGIHTVSVSPFSSPDVTICPSQTQLSTYFNFSFTFGRQVFKVDRANGWRVMNALFPSGKVMLQSYFDEGYMAAYRFLIRNNLLSYPIGTPV